MRQLLPHISIGTHESGRVFLEIEDYELFDFIDDYLTEKCDIPCESRNSRERPGGEIITLYFPMGTTTQQIEEKLVELPTAEIIRIYSLNNP